MKPKIVVTREIFDEVLDYLHQHCEVDHNQADVPYTPAALAARLAACDGLMCALTDRVDAALIAHSPLLKAVANIAVGIRLPDRLRRNRRGPGHRSSGSREMPACGQGSRVEHYADPRYA